jgi:hypothetical protein
MIDSARSWPGAASDGIRWASIAGQCQAKARPTMTTN